MEYFIHIIISGLSSGSMYGLAALGFVIIYRSSHVLNFSHGHLIAVGACTTYLVVSKIDVSIWLSIPIGVLVAGIIGSFIEFFIIRPTTNKSEVQKVIATLGLAILFNGLIMITPFGSHSYSFTKSVSSDIANIFGMKIDMYEIYTILFAFIVIIMFVLFFKFTKIGMAIRAANDDAIGALACGVSLSRINQVSWIAASGAAAIAGIIISYKVGLEAFNLVHIGLVVLPIVILGGLESPAGAILGGVIVGLLEQISIGYIDTWIGVKNTGGVLPFFLLIIFLLFRPNGLCGSKKIDRV